MKKKQSFSGFAKRSRSTKVGLAMRLILLFMAVSLVQVNAANAFSIEKVQQNPVKGKVLSSTDGIGMPGVNVTVKGTTIGVTTDADGNYTLNAPADAVLVFSFVGYEKQEVAVGGRKEVAITLTEETKTLQEIVVVGYGTQAKKDITGSVIVVDADALKSIPASNLGKQLAGRAAGITVSSSGDPSASTSIRIRGIGSVNDNGPLIVIDGVSTRDQNLNSINPNDVESVQILKDASSAAIYGSQASNGVVIITTKKGSKDKTSVSYSGFYGVQKIAKSYDLLNTQGWMNMWQTAAKNTAILRNWGQGININRTYDDLFNDANLWANDVNYKESHAQFGSIANPSIPAYVIPTGAATADEAAWTAGNRITKVGDTDWVKEITQVAPMQSHQLGISGGGEKGVYSLGLNYYDQEGIVKYTKMQRYQFRANSEYKIKKYIKVGENFMFNRQSDNSNGAQNEGWALSQAYRLPSWVPVYDVRGNFAGSGAKASGNGQNPYAMLYRAKDNSSVNFRTFGNVYAEVNFLKDFTFKTSFGLDYKNGSGYWLTYPNPEHSEGSNNNGFNEWSNWSMRWQFSNTLTFTKVLSDVHRINVLVGTEAIRDGLGRQIEGNRTGYLFINDPNTWSLGNGNPTGMVNNSYFWGDYSLFGIFGRVDYSFKDKYLATLNVRRDGVSRFSESNRYGIFPSLSIGWRLSQEDFMKGLTWLDDLKIIAGYGITGNAEVPNAYNYAYTYGLNAGDFNYDIAGINSGAALGMKLTKYGNTDTKWEEVRGSNVGISGALFSHKLEFNVEGYIKQTSGMLVQDAYLSEAGGAGAPYVNLGEMKNTGFDVSLTNRGTIVGDLKYEISANISHYKNEVVKINNNPDTKFFGGGDSRFGSLTILTKGEPMSAFYGYQIEGIYKTKEELAGHAKQPNINNSPADLAGNAWRASIGKWKLQDSNGDGVVDGKDKTILGSPHPKFTYGFDFNLSFKSFDLNMFIMGSQGNKIFNYVKYWTDFNGSFIGQKSNYMVNNSWNPTSNATTDTPLPILVTNDGPGANTPTSYYVEDGSYLRCKNLQLGYTLPKNVLNKVGIDHIKIYIQAINLFTITKYTGLEPDLGTRYQGGGSGGGNAAGSEWERGIDFGAYPQPKQYMVGVNVSF